MPADICMHPWNYAVEPFCILGNLFYVGNRDVSSHLIDTGQGLILLDTAFPQTVYLLLESVRKLGYNPAEIHTIVHCHGHYDHLGGTRAIVELTGAQTALGRADVEILTHRPELSWAPEYGVEFHEAFTVDLPLDDGCTLSVGKTTIECVGIPGHTPGAMAYFFQVEDKGQSYRVGIHGGPGLNTLTQEYLDQYDLDSSRRSDYMRSLERLKERAVDVFIGAHPAQNQTLPKRAQMAESRNPFVDPAA